MYLSNLHLQNWRTYGDASFSFKEPTRKRSVVLIGAMNGHGKTSFLMSLYLGLFGKFGLRHCEGFSNFGNDDFKSYRDAISKFRRNTAAPDEPTVIDLTLSPSWRDADEEEEVRIVRRWYFGGKNEPKQGASFEEVDIYVGGRLQKPGSLEKDPLLLAQERVERNLFPAHVAPAFFFDGEQAQKLIETAGERGLKKAVEVMFGTKVIGEVCADVAGYLTRLRQTTGGKKKTSEQQESLERKLAERNAINDQLAKKQAALVQLEQEKDEKEEERSRLQENLARMGGTAGGTVSQIQIRLVTAENEQLTCEKALAEEVRQLGLSLGVFRLAPAIRNRLKSEAERENWESLKRGTIENRDKVLDVALPEPDQLLGNLSKDVLAKVRDRFSDALERIYNPPPNNCASEYLLGHVKGEARNKVLAQLSQAQSVGAARLRAFAKNLRNARETYEDTKRELERVKNIPSEVTSIKEQMDALNSQIQEAIRHIGAIENENKTTKSKLNELNKEISQIQEELARLGPEQQRIAISERVCRALEALQERLTPTTTARLEAGVTKHFISIADPRFRKSKIQLKTGEPPQLSFSDGRPPLLLEVNSGFERRAFGIAFSLALAEITQRRVPLVIDTPLGNADSEYRPRTLKALAEIDLDQIIILTHDKEVTGDLLPPIRGQISQQFLVEYNEAENLSAVFPDRYFSI